MNQLISDAQELENTAKSLENSANPSDRALAIAIWKQIEYFYQLMH